jgi:hypothetical protein
VLCHCLVSCAIVSRAPHAAARAGRSGRGGGEVGRTCVTDIRLTVLAELIKRIDGIA